jgi:hypothetical protein
MDKLRAAKPFRSGNIAFIAIEHSFTHSRQSNDGFWFAAYKELHAIIICDDSGIHAFDRETREISLESLVETVADLDEKLLSLGYDRPLS